MTSATPRFELSLPVGPPTSRPMARPCSRGKFLWRGGEKLYLRGVTYGPFRPLDDGSEYHTPDLVRRDFSMMRAAGLNAVRVYTVPPRWLLDLAGEYNLLVLAGLTGASAVPRNITRLNKGHSVVYRLTGIAPDGGSVIAKLCWRGDVEKTRAVHLSVLPLVPKPALLLYGTQEARFEAGWLFLEDAGETKYSPGSPRHRRAASAWLAALHTSMAAHSQDLSLPETGLAAYRHKLRDALGRMAGSLSRAELDPDDLTTLRSAIGWCERIESLWNEVVALVADGPHTLVHGDLAPKNILLREAAGHLDVFPVDWETAGWGPPAVDLGDPLDLAAYLDQALRLGATWTMAAVRRWAAVGRVLRHIASIEWASASLEGGWPPRGVRRIKARLSDAMEAAKLEP